MIKDLIKKVSQGDNSALEQLYDLTYHKVFVIIFRIVKDRAVAEDLVHDTYIRIWNKADMYIPLFNDERWILRVGRNLAYDYLRKLKTATDYESEQIYMNSLKPFDITEFNESEILSDLSDEEKTAIMYKVAGYKQKEISDLIGCNIDKVKNLNRTAKKKIVTRIGGKK